MRLTRLTVTGSCCLAASEGRAPSLPCLCGSCSGTSRFARSGPTPTESSQSLLLFSPSATKRTKRRMPCLTFCTRYVIRQLRRSVWGKYFTFSLHRRFRSHSTLQLFEGLHDVAQHHVGWVPNAFFVTNLVITLAFLLLFAHRTRLLRLFFLTWTLVFLFRGTRDPLSDYALMALSFARVVSLFVLRAVLGC